MLLISADAILKSLYKEILCHPQRQTGIIFHKSDGESHSVMTSYCPQPYPLLLINSGKIKFTYVDAKHHSVY